MGASGALRAGVLVVSILAVAAAAGPDAHAAIYWTQANPDGRTPGTIGRANLDGGRVVPDFIRNSGQRPAIPGSPFGVAVNSDTILWGNGGIPLAPSSIGVARIDGFFAGDYFEARGAWGVAVNDRYIFWANRATEAIGRATADGRARNQSFIAGGQPCGVAVDNEHVYWTNVQDGTIGRANLDGTGVNQRFIVIPGTSFACGIAVDSEHLYWTNRISPTAGRGSIGRANLDGSGVTGSFIGVAGEPCGIAVDRSFVYWGTFPGPPTGQAMVGRAMLNGQGANPSFINPSTRNLICGVAVDRRGAGEAGGFRFGKARRDTSNGTATLPVRTSERGELVLHRGRKIRAARRKAEPGRTKLPIRPRAKGKQRLTLTGKVRVRARVTFKPRNGPRKTKTKALKLILR